MRERNERRERKPKRKARWTRVLALSVFLLFLVTAGVGLGYTAVTVMNMPDWDPDKFDAAETTLVYDHKGEVAAQLHAQENRENVKLSRIPRYLQYAVIATEDDHFYQHHGIRLEAIARAVLVNLVKGYGSEGGSTITMQLVKNIFFEKPEKKMERKIQEAFLALRMERQYTKDEILEMYLNRIPFGEGAYGVQAAAQTYFGKDVENLTLAECALLAGLPNGPSIYSPFRHPEAALERRSKILSRMVECGYLTEAQAQQAEKEPLNLNRKGSVTYNHNQYFVDCVIEETEEILKKLGVYENPQSAIYHSGLRIYTTLDQELQRFCEDIYSQDKYFPPGKKDQMVQSAAVVLNPHTGEVKTIIGGRNYTQKRGFNRAVDARRQPGSAFKPIAVYAPALSKGFSPAYVLDDSPVSYKTGNQDWSPQNYDGKYRGPITMRLAVQDSINIYAVKLLDQIGVSEGVRFAENLGISTLVKSGSKNDYNLSLALGGLTKGVSPLEMAAAFGTFANQGVYVKPYTIEKITDRENRVLYQHRSQQQVVMDPRSAYLMTSMLQSVIQSGTGTRANIGRPAGGKTGTTSDDTNAWFVGYTPDLAAAVWVGYDNQNESMRNVYGGNYPGPIWKAIMQKAHENIPVHDFAQPAGIAGAVVCRRSGKLPGPNCPLEDQVTELFVEGQAPSEVCDVHVLAEVCPESGKLATPSCPSRMVRSFIKRPDEAVASNPLPEDLPRESCPLHGGNISQSDKGPEPDVEIPSLAKPNERRKRR